MKDIAFAMLSKDEFNLRNCDSSLDVTANPAGSSDGLLNLEPVERRLRELESWLVLTDRFLAVFSATLLELITTEWVLFLSRGLIVGYPHFISVVEALPAEGCWPGPAWWFPPALKSDIWRTESLLQQRQRRQSSRQQR